MERFPLNGRIRALFFQKLFLHCVPRPFGSGTGPYPALLDKSCGEPKKLDVQRAQLARFVLLAGRVEAAAFRQVEPEVRAGQVVGPEDLTLAVSALRFTAFKVDYERLVGHRVRG